MASLDGQNFQALVSKRRPAFAPSSRISVPTDAYLIAQYGVILSQMKQSPVERSVSSRDVAELAGVSQATVSRVLNDFSHVNPKTRARVEMAMRELNYRPSAAARSLMTQRT